MYTHHCSKIGINVIICLQELITLLLLSICGDFFWVFDNLPHVVNTVEIPHITLASPAESEIV